MNNWYEYQKAAAWLDEGMTPDNYREVNRVFQNRDLLEEAIHLLVSRQYPLYLGRIEHYHAAIEEIKESLLKSHEAALLVTYLKTQHVKFLNEGSEEPNSNKLPLLSESQVEVSENKKNEVIYFLEDLIYFLQDKSPAWWYRCPSLLYAFNTFKNSVREGSKTAI